MSLIQAYSFTSNEQAPCYELNHIKFQNPKTSLPTSINIAQTYNAIGLLYRIS